jgi:beta-1,4-mannosyl-glycoprotein beta-1,4-N-acetylglucosaminyltransferase
MKKIYDGFTFFNELDLLELRLEELYHHIDYFVIVESDHTFTNIPKPYYFKENATRFAKFMDKIRYIKIKSLGDSDPWTNEAYQRNQIMQGCHDAADDDIVMVSDVDEIPRPEVIDHIRNTDSEIYVVNMPFFYYKFNFVSIRPDLVNFPLLFAALPSIVSKLGGTHPLRHIRTHFMKEPYQYENYKCEVIEHGGWHFGYLGDNEFVKLKFVSFSHASELTPEQVENINIESEIHDHSERVIVKIDHYFPTTILNNLEKYQKYIATSGDKSMKDYFTNIPDEL